MSDLFERGRQDLRAAMTRAGWRPAGGLLGGRFLWRAPGEDGAVDEEEAFRRFRREQGGKGAGHATTG